MKSKEIYRLRTFHGTSLFYDPAHGPVHCKVSDFPEVLLDFSDGSRQLFINHASHRLSVTLVNNTDPRNPSPFGLAQNPDGSFSLISGNRRLIALPNGSIIFEAVVSDWAHFTLEPFNANRAPVDRDHCAGCTACAAVCPRKAISMVEDDEGFMSPTTDPERCIDCGLCDRVCPIRNPNRNPAPEISYAAWINNDECRTRSSSGGAAYALAKYAVDRDFVVCGAAMEDFTVKHILAERPDDLVKLQGSKYVQSYLGDIFVEIKRLLGDGRKVLFVGTPCQVAGLKNFIGDNETLTTVDLICHGVPSPGVLRRYISELRRRYPTAASMSFREYSGGWSTAYSFALFDSAREKIFSESNAFNPYLRGFLDNTIDRRSCAHCPFATNARVGDITIGDYWGIARYDKELDDGKGTSLVLVNTERGRQLYDSIANLLARNVEIPVNFAFATQWTLNRPTIQSNFRAEFFKHYLNGGNVENYLGDRLLPVGILNMCHGNNMGAMLVAYSVARAVEQLEYSTMIINAFPNVRQAKTLKNFLSSHLRLSAPCSTVEQLKALNSSFRKIIVGSDQVWKFEDTKTYMLDWASGYKSFISYAASFGTNTYSGNITLEQATKLLKRFDFISVREASGVDICREQFGVSAVHVIDPTMLLTREHYNKLIESDTVVKPSKTYVAYTFFDAALKAVVQGESLAELRRKFYLWNVMTDERGELRTVSSWLAGIRDAEYVVTNSFHGTVFSILFNKQFVVVDAPGRGNARLPSLLKMLNIPQSRYKQSLDEVTLAALDEPIDYYTVNQLIAKEREKGFLFLKMALSAPPRRHEPV